ncbi:hypothetical protein AGMMS49942_03190 [Spirochaetia bacterium]|nr:hypothetical protein AGMMS49942_03190 [Spirochaetia bacterium]
MKYILCALIFVFLSTPALFAEGSVEGVSPQARSRYLSNNGIILPPGDLDIDSYLSSYDFGYPEPQTSVGLSIFNSVKRTLSRGAEGLLQIGLRAKSPPFDELPPLNLVLVIDTSRGMNDNNKLAWFKTAVGAFIQKVRNIDALSLVSFSNTAQVVFQPTLMDTFQKRRAFMAAVDSLVPQGDPNIEAGITLGYEQAIPYFRPNSINQVLLFSAAGPDAVRLLMPNLNTGDIRVTLTWNNRNDLDLHVEGPTGEEIMFDKPRDSRGGYLDADSNPYGETRKPEETIFWPDNRALRGTYRVYVQNYLSNEPAQLPTPFQVEVKNGNEYLTFNGTLHGVGRTSLTEVCTFEYAGTGEFDHLSQLAARRKQQGIVLSTMGLGSTFDGELLRTLAMHGGGAFRALGTQKMVTDVMNIDREFTRIAVPPVKTLSVELNFNPGLEIQEVLGVPGRIAGTRVTCTIPNLHPGDYKTLFVRYRIPPRTRGLQTASLRITGGESPPDTFEQTLTLTEPVNEYARKMLRHSVAVVDFALALKEIGGHYYSAELDARRYKLAQRLSRDTKRSLESAKRNIQAGALTQELAVMTRYVEILSPANGTLIAGGVLPINETRSVNETLLASGTRPISEVRQVDGALLAGRVLPISETPPAGRPQPITETRRVNEAPPADDRIPPQKEERPTEDEDPPKEPTVIREEVRIVEREKEEPTEGVDTWKYHWLFLNARVGGSFRLYLSTEDSDIPNSSALAPDVGFEMEVHFFNFLALQFGINYALDNPEYQGMTYEGFPLTVKYPTSLLSTPFMVKGIFNPSLRSTLGPYAGVYLNFPIIGPAKSPLLGVLGGLEFATKVGPGAGAIFFDMRYSQDIGSTEVTAGPFYYDRLFITLSIGYKYGLFKKKH